MPDKAPGTRETNKATNQHQYRADPPARQSPAALTEQADPLALQRAIADPRAATPRDILALQRLAGNRAVTRLIQASLTVGPAGDRYEQEADRVADQVVSSQPSAVPQGGFALSGRRSDVSRQAEEEEEIQTKPLAASITPLVQRQAEEEEEIQTFPSPGGRGDRGEGEIQRRADGAFDAGPDVESRLASHKGGGSPLPDDVRATMEPRFGTDFSGVRVHTGGEADHLNRQLSAQAFTHGQDIYMGAGKYAPGTTAGNRLLAHELTHVIQQGSAVKRIGRRIVQRVLIDEATRAFTTVGTRQHKDPTAAPDYVGPTYPQIKTLTDQLVPKGDQETLIKLRSRKESWFTKSPEPEKKLKDVIRAFLLGQYAIRLDRLKSDGKLDATQKKAKAKLYLEKDVEARDKQASLLEKGVAAPETQSFLNYHGFAGLVPVTLQQTTQERAKGPRIDVRATFLAIEIFGMKLRGHLFIIYTGSDGKQLYFRGGPGGPGGVTRADMGEYTPNTVDWDPSAPSVTLLQGDAAKEKLDALIEAAGIITGMGVPYRGEEGENCNATAWTILTRAGITPQKPVGVHPGWGHVLGAVTPGKEHAEPAKEDVSSPGTPKAVKGAATTSIQVYLDRNFTELGPKLKGGTTVDLLAGFGVDRAKIRYEGRKIGYIDATQLELPPVPGKSFKLRGETTVRRVDSMEEVATLKGGTVVQVIDLGFTAVPKDAQGDQVRIRYLDRDNEKREGQVSDWDLEDIK